MAQNGEPPTRRCVLAIVICLEFMSVPDRIFAGDTNDTTRIPEILVTASPLLGSASPLGRSVQIIESSEIENSGAASAEDALEMFTAVSVSERGASEVQSDLSLRGSTFQQILITLNGVPLTDPQTAHHNMNLPFPIAAVERIAVIQGPGTALFGPAAFAGVINLSLRIPKSSGLRFHSGFGSFDTWRFGALADHVHGKQFTTLAASYSQSDGFQDGTDYDNTSLWGSSFTDFDSGSLRVSLGHTDKDFGAQDFYASYPSRERTSITLFDLAPAFDFDNGWSLAAIVRYRHHSDEFILYEDNPDYYQNRHKSDSFTERLVLNSPTWLLGTTALGVEHYDTSLDSSNLGNRNAFISSAFFQHRVSQGMWAADLGLRADDHDRWGTEISPSLGMSVEISEQVRVYASAARGIRPPSFTELHYTDPINTGNPDLEPEEAWGGEVGVGVKITDDLQVSASYFHHRSKNLIDWVRGSSEEAWQASNTGEVTTQGAEVGITADAARLKLRPSYRYTDLDTKSQGLESKYALNVPEHDIGLSATLPETHGFTATVSARYRDVRTLDQYWLLDARVAKRFGRITAYALGKNLLDENYEEIPGVPTAGTYGELGMEILW